MYEWPSAVYLWPSLSDTKDDVGRIEIDDHQYTSLLQQNNLLIVCVRETPEDVNVLETNKPEVVLSPTRKRRMIDRCCQTSGLGSTHAGKSQDKKADQLVRQFETR